MIAAQASAESAKSLEIRELNTLQTPGYNNQCNLWDGIVDVQCGARWGIEFGSAL